MAQSMLDMSLDEILAAGRASAAGSTATAREKASGAAVGKRDEFASRFPTRLAIDKRTTTAFRKQNNALFRGRDGRNFSGDRGWWKGDFWQGEKRIFQNSSKFSGRFSRGTGLRGAFGGKERDFFFPSSALAYDYRATGFAAEWTNSFGGDDRAYPAAAGGSQFAPQRAVVRVSNLDYTILEDDLRELFTAAGDVLKVWIDYDRTDRSRGTGGGVFRSVADAKRAIRMYEGKKIEGLPLHLELQLQGGTGAAGASRSYAVNNSVSGQRTGEFFHSGRGGGRGLPRRVVANVTRESNRPSRCAEMISWEV